MPRKRTKKTGAIKSIRSIRRGKVLTDFIICESVRQELNGKQTLLGVYGDEINFKDWPENDEEEKVGLQLSFFLRFYFVDGQESAKARLKGPSKQPLFSFDFSFQKLPKPGGMTSLVVVGPGSSLLIIPELGTYTFEFDYDGKRDKRVFHVRVDPSAFPVETS